MSTFNDIKLEVYDRLQLSSSPPTAVATKIGRYINRWHRKILSGAQFRSLRRVQLTQASVADQWRYGTQLEEIFHITERTNDRRLVKKDEDWWRTRFPDPTSFTGTPRNWVHLGEQRVLIQPTAAAELFIKSTSAADTTQSALVEAVRSDGSTVSLSVTLTGVTAVTFNAAETDIVAVVDFYLSAVGAGTITLHQDSGAGATLATINIANTSTRSLTYALAPTPSAVLTYYLDGVARIVDMSSSADEPLFPSDFHDILVDAAVYDEWLTHGRLKEAQWLRDEIRQRELQMRNWVWMNASQDEPDGGESRSFEDTVALPIS